MDVTEKLKRLNIVPITEEIYLEHIKPFEQEGFDASSYCYYKMYGNAPMLFSYEYLDAHTIKELKQKARKSYIRFNPTFITKLLFRFQVWRFKYL